MSNSSSAVEAIILQKLRSISLLRYALLSFVTRRESRVLKIVATSQNPKTLYIYRDELAKIAWEFGVPRGKIEIWSGGVLLCNVEYLNQTNGVVMNQLFTTNSISEYRKRLQDREGAIFGVSLSDDRNLAVSPGACKVMQASEYDLLTRDLRPCWQRELIHPADATQRIERPEPLLDLLKLLRQQSTIRDHCYEGRKGKIWGRWRSNIQVIELEPWLYLREMEGLEFIPC